MTNINFIESKNGILIIKKEFIIFIYEELNKLKEKKENIQADNLAWLLANNYSFTKECLSFIDYIGMGS